MTFSFRSASLLTAALAVAALTGCPSTPAPSDGGAPDSGSPADAGTRHPAGFTVAVPLPQGANASDFGSDVALALDEHGDPLLAYAWGRPGGVAADGAVYFTRWDASAAAWTPPLAIETIGPIFTNAPLRHVAIAYDIATKRIGVAYGRFNIRTPPRNELVYSTHLALSSDDGKTFTSELVSERQRTDSGGEEAYLPSLALANGATHLAYFQRWQRCTSGTGSDCHGVWYLTRAGASGAFTRTLVPLPLNGTGSRALSPVLALDSAGAAAVAYLVGESGSTTQIAFWRPGSASAVKALDSAGVQNDGPTLALAFDGLKPRIATTLTSEASPAGDLRVASSDDGTTWALATLPRDGGAFTRSFVALVAGPLTAVAAKHTGGTSAGACGAPKVARSVGGAAWTTCGLDKAVLPSAAGEYVSLATAPAGTLVMAFQHTDTANAKLAPGLVVWTGP